jgi:hypothetical protein
MTLIPTSTLSLTRNERGLIVYALSRRLRQTAQDTEPQFDPTDDGGSGLYEVCRNHFDASEYMVTCDERHTVWVKRTDGARSIGLPPWILRQQSLAETLERTEAKLTVQV